jgi:FkbM family methyltransferase
MLYTAYGLWRTGAWRSRRWRLLLAETFARTRYAYVGDHKALLRTCDGHRMFVDTHDVWVTPHLIIDGYYAVGVERVMRREVKPGQIVIDIGAHFGYYTLVMASLVAGKNNKAKGRVLAFEPQLRTGAILRDNVRINHYSHRVSVYPFALGAADSVQQIVIPRSSTGGAHIDWRDKADRAVSNDEHEVHDVNVKRLDQVLAGAKVTAFDFVKIDAEGYEAAIIEGFGAFLDQPGSKILMEWSVPQLASRGDPRSLLARLRTAGYRLCEIAPDGTCAPRSDDELMAIESTDLFLSRP